MQFITDAVRRHAADSQSADKKCVIAGQFSLTYSELQTYSVLTAEWLRQQGVAPGDRVLLTVGACDPWFPVIYLGTHLAGAVAVPLDAQVAEATRASIRAQVEPAMEIAGEVLSHLKEHLQSHPPLSGFEGVPALPHMTADLLFTSGTTGEPKGIVLSHANISAAAENMTAFIGNGPNDREVVTVPLSHSFGLGRLRSNLLVGGTVILVPGLKFPALVFRALEEHEATGLACVPAGAAVMLKWGAARLQKLAPRLRYMEIGSASMPMPLKHQLMELLPGARLCMHYGLTEASRSAFIEFHTDEARLASVGRPAPNVRIQIADEAGVPMPPGAIGRIRIQGASVLKGYWKNDSLTRQRLDASGWFDTGDLGCLDAEGYLYFHGRGDDLINVGGKKVYPAVVEKAALAHPDILDAACVGKEDSTGVLGEVPVLFAVRNDSSALPASELIRFIAGRVEPHAVPSAVEFIAALPRTAAGKVQHSELRRSLSSTELRATHG